MLHLGIGRCSAEDQYDRVSTVCQQTSYGMNSTACLCTTLGYGSIEFEWGAKYGIEEGLTVGTEDRGTLGPYKTATT